ncbi:LutC/YkgG family protein [Flavilitoribacter nigricans]|uniref:Lactate utilization protein B/C n=1 Tax=Flavilitoribacter nigricans (strain ATCC 23147 / DSM 23189 / NBRC 102662 / NCIMB 1420 / SS-2) TaxID=1122177 RepID=A0A2D0N1A6_FLAN2|nr:LUD domain-containing protein [Flavilitoribacter nigricans]PHN02304.1 lactate utilization protein B/C [Flavilitoribacter nigricans DSM 23189 = NBRC 102662]
MSREKILRAIKENKPAVSPLPDPPSFPPITEEVLPYFMEMVEKSGGRVHLLEAGEHWEDLARQHYPDSARVLCRIPDSTLGNTELDQIQRLTDLHGLDLAILPALVGVAENAAVWLTEKEMGQRVVPFIAEHLILLLDRKNIVGNMHEAYGRIEIDEPGFGLFIAGPSKTADIEQSLVIGAQGPRTWLVLIV